MSPPRIAIIGSRDWPEWALDRVARVVSELPFDAMVVSGGARGVDSAAVAMAKRRGLTTWEICPDPEIITARGFGAAAFARNREIAEFSDMGIAFQYHRSKGTQNTIEIFLGMNKAVEIHRINALRVFTGFAGDRWDDALDITRKSAEEDGLAFAPSWALLTPYLEKRRRLELTAADFEAYAHLYTDEMRESFARRRAAWDWLLGLDEVTLVCYCNDPARCHRTILARDILPKLGAVYEGERQTQLPLL